MVEFYTHEKVTEHITAIRSMTGEIMYLIEGQKRAVLVDTCLGVGHLKNYVEKLTEKPLEVILTHGHIDHAMGASEFEKVYMNHKDEYVYLSMRGLEDRKGYIQANLGGVLPDLEEDDFVEPGEMNFENLEDGKMFDLGGIHVKIYALAGHTKGTMVVLIQEEKVLILGDACNTATFLFDENSLTVEEYRENLMNFNQKLAGTYDRVFLCHHDMEVSSKLIENVIQVCDDIMNGNTDDLPFEFMGQKNYIAKEIKAGFRRLDGIDGNIIYNKNKIWKAK